MAGFDRNLPGHIHVPRKCAFSRVIGQQARKSGKSPRCMTGCAVKSPILSLARTCFREEVHLHPIPTSSHTFCQGPDSCCVCFLWSITKSSTVIWLPVWLRFTEMLLGRRGGKREPVGEIHKGLSHNLRQTTKKSYIIYGFVLNFEVTFFFIKIFSMLSLFSS